MDEQRLEQRYREMLVQLRALEQRKSALGEPVHRIGFGSGLVMKLGAATLDILGLVANFVPFIGGFIASILSVVGNILFAIGYMLLGIKPLPKNNKGGDAVRKTLIIRVICFFFEIIPFVNVLPGFSIAIWSTSAIIRREDKKHNAMIRNEIKTMSYEESRLRSELQKVQTVLQQYEEAEYNEQYEVAEQNQVHDEDEQGSIAA